MAKYATDEAREEAAARRAEERTMARIGKVLDALDYTGKTRQQLSDETGYSGRLIGSTIRKARGVYADHPGEPIAYDPVTREYRLTADYDDTEAWTAWTTKYLRTRTEGFIAAMDVIAARYRAAVPPSIRLMLRQQRILLELQEDVILEIEAEERAREKDRAPHHSRGVSLHG